MAQDLSLTFAVGSAARFQPVLDGTIRPQGINSARQQAVVDQPARRVVETREVGCEDLHVMPQFPQSLHQAINPGESAAAQQRV